MVQKHKNKLFTRLLWWINLVFAGLILLANLTGKIAPASFSALAILGLVYPILVLIQIVFLIIWLLITNIRFLLPLLVLIISYSNIQLFVGMHCKQQPVSSQTINLFTYNVQGFSSGIVHPWDKALKQSVLTYAIHKKSSIICMQEYKSSYQIPQNLKQFTRGGTYYFKNYFGGDHWRGNGLLLASRYPSVGHGFFNLKGGRIFAIYADLLIGKTTLRVFSIHLESIGLSSRDLKLLVTPVSEEAVDQKGLSQWKKIYRKLTHTFVIHQRQIELLREQIKNSPYPVIIAGDFNDTPASYAYHQISKDLHDTFLDKACSMQSTYAGPLPFLRIDHVFVPKPFSTLFYQRFKVNFSDHFPLMVGIQFRK